MKIKANPPAPLALPSCSSAAPWSPRSPRCSTYAALLALQASVLKGPLQDWVALWARSHAVCEGAVPTEGPRFAAWVRTVPTTHASRVQELHCVYCSAPCFGWGDYMARHCVVIVTTM